MLLLAPASESTRISLEHMEWYLWYTKASSGSSSLEDTLSHFQFKSGTHDADVTTLQVRFLFEKQNYYLFNSLKSLISRESQKILSGMKIKEA